MISQDVVTAVSNHINQTGLLNEQVISQLRNTYAGVHFTYCSDDDISEVPAVLEQDMFNIYLVNGYDHCLKMTNDFEAATGIVVAEIYQD